jgi:hypothetical protein
MFVLYFPKVYHTVCIQWQQSILINHNNNVSIEIHYIQYSQHIYQHKHKWYSFLVWLMVFNATFNITISAISWRSVLLVEETRGPGENHRSVASHWQILSHNVDQLQLPFRSTHLAYSNRSFKYYIPTNNKIQMHYCTGAVVAVIVW